MIQRRNRASIAADCVLYRRVPADCYDAHTGEGKPKGPGGCYSNDFVARDSHCSAQHHHAGFRLTWYVACGTSNDVRILLILSTAGSSLSLMGDSAFYFIAIDAQGLDR